MKNPSFFIVEIHYHELAELREFRKLGYSDYELGNPTTGDQNYGKVHALAKKQELEFCQTISKKTIGKTPPFIAWVFGCRGVCNQHGITPLTYEELYYSLEKKTDFYSDPFTIEDVEDVIEVYRKGGDDCPDKNLTLAQSRDYLRGVKPLRLDPPWIYA